MTVIRAYTTIEQSRKLAKILPLESADMHILIDEYAFKFDFGFSKETQDFYNTTRIEYIPAWSLASLLSVIHDYTLQTNTDGTVSVVCESDKPMISDAYDNPVDACVAMIENLYE